MHGPVLQNLLVQNLELKSAYRKIIGLGARGGRD